MKNKLVIMAFFISGYIFSLQAVQNIRMIYGLQKSVRCVSHLGVLSALKAPAHLSVRKNLYTSSLIENSVPQAIKIYNLTDRQATDLFKNMNAPQRRESFFKEFARLWPDIKISLYLSFLKILDPGMCRKKQAEFERSLKRLELQEALQEISELSSQVQENMHTARQQRNLMFTSAI